jgi:uncharacterized protein (DUF1499 family)
VRRIAHRVHRTLLIVIAAALPSMAPASPFASLFAGERPADVGTGRLAPCPDRPNCVASDSADPRHAIAPLPRRGDTITAMACIARAVAAVAGARIVVQRSDYLYAEFESRVMGFVDDVEFLADPAADAIRVRSASRLGYADFGVNRRRIEAIRAACTVPP